MGGFLKNKTMRLKREKMKYKTSFTILLTFMILILISGCAKKQEIVEVETPVMVETKNNTQIKVIENETQIIEIEISKEELKRCSQDSDCIKIQGGCCPCTDGGGNIAINKKYEEYWNNKLTKECIGTRNICLAVMMACGGNVGCINKSCTFV